MLFSVKSTGLGVMLMLCMQFSTPLHAQDSVYYAPAFNLKGADLKAALHALIAQHTTFKYTSSSQIDVWDILKETDKDTVNPNNVILIYSGRSVDGPQEYNGGNGWTREHVWAKSRGDFGTSEGPGTDVHHIRPCDNNVNSTRNNRNFDACITCENVMDDGMPTGSQKDANLWTFMPPLAVRGDVARMLFYMAVRYEGGANEPDLELVDFLLDKTDQRPFQSNLTTLMQWHLDDPVSDWERRRNETIYGDYQGNRNPFIDYPELVSYLWGADTVNIWKPKVTSTTTIIPQPAPIVYPNPTKESVRFTDIMETVAVFNSQGHLLFTRFNCKEVSLQALAKGMYIIRVNEQETYRIIRN